jgi:hypothetical protein
MNSIEIPKDNICEDTQPTSNTTKKQIELVVGQMIVPSSKSPRELTLNNLTVKELDGKGGYIDMDGIARDGLGRKRRAPKSNNPNVVSTNPDADTKLLKIRRGRHNYDPSMKEIMLVNSQAGKSLTQIACILSQKYNLPIIADTILSWEKTEGENYGKHLKLCRTYAQAYHEDILAKMISGETPASASQIEGQKWKLKTLFADWGDKAQKIEVSQMDGMSDKTLESKVTALLKRTGQLPVDLKLVAKSQNKEERI